MVTGEDTYKSFMDRTMVSISRDGKEYLIIQKGGFVASFIDGKWEPKLLFCVEDMNDFLIQVNDEKEALRIFKEARHALGLGDE